MTTFLANIIEPEVFNPYFIHRTAELSALIQSGIVQPDATFDILARSGGRTINMPFWSDLDATDANGADEILGDGASYTGLTPGGIATAQDIACLLARGRAWGASDLSAALAGSDPMKAIADRVAHYWARREQKILLAILAGVFADNVANDDGDLVHSIGVADPDANTPAEDNLINSSAIIDAVTKTHGDVAEEKITAMMMHSVPYARLLKLKLIDFVEVKNSDGTSSTAEGGPKGDVALTVPTFLGKRVIVDDGCPRVAGTTAVEYTTYLFGPGAIARGEGAPKVPSETDRDSLKGEDYLITRRHLILHPRGIAWQSPVIDTEFPDNADLLAAASWSRVWERKNIRLCKLVTNG